MKTLFKDIKKQAIIINPAKMQKLRGGTQEDKTDDTPNDEAVYRAQ